MKAPASEAGLGPSLVLFEDEHLLVVNKPAGWNTHAPSPYAGEGIYDWLRHREPRWSTLAIMHRLDKDTSGVLVFTKTAMANRSVTEQFTRRQTRKRYLLWTDRPVPAGPLVATSTIERDGERYVSRAFRPGADRAETHFLVRSVPADRPGTLLVEAEPVTGRTHQIRVHAAEHGFPILGDALYGGTPAARLHLHAESLTFQHPVSGQPVTFSAPAGFEADARARLREAMIDLNQTDAWRALHGASDGCAGWYVDRLGPYALVQSAEALTSAHLAQVPGWPGRQAVYHRRLDRQVRRTAPAEVSPQWVEGTAVIGPFEIRENGLRFELSFDEGYSVGLFLDQRDNRRRLLVNHIAADFPVFEGGLAGREVLNTFAYTCGFSVCAARSGARVTSLDLSRKYLEWGRRNFQRNEVDPAAHDFIHGDVFNWLARLARKGRRFDVVLLDPPTFSQSRESGVFRAEHDYGKLVESALSVLQAGGILLASTNAAGLAADEFVAMVTAAVRRAGRREVQRHYVPQPPDFPISRAEPAYLKTIWLRVG